MKVMKPPIKHGKCTCDAHDSLGVTAALDNLLHFHVLHSDNAKFSAWANDMRVDGVSKEVEVLVISDPALLERVRKVLQAPPPGITGGTIH